MYLVSDAIVVGRRMVANTSLVLRCYTERAGGLVVFAKGAFRRRRRAEPPSVPDLFQRGEVVLSTGPGRGYSILREWSLEDVRRGVRESPPAFRAASACASIVAALPGEPFPGGEHFAALEEALGELDRSATAWGGAAGRAAAGVARRAPGAPYLGGSPRPVVWAFALGVLSRAGFLAPLDSCALCGALFGRGGAGLEATAASPLAGGLVCRGCARRAEGSVELTPEAASAARFLARATMDAAARLRCSPDATRALDRAVREFAEHHLERAFPALAPEEGEP